MLQLGFTVLTTDGVHFEMFLPTPLMGTFKVIIKRQVPSFSSLTSIPEVDSPSRWVALSVSLSIMTLMCLVSWRWTGKNASAVVLNRGKALQYLKLTSSQFNDWEQILRGCSRHFGFLLVYIEASPHVGVEISRLDLFSSIPLGFA